MEICTPGGKMTAARLTGGFTELSKAGVVLSAGLSSGLSAGLASDVSTTLITEICLPSRLVLSFSSDPLPYSSAKAFVLFSPSEACFSLFVLLTGADVELELALAEDGCAEEGAEAGGGRGGGF